MLFSCYEAKLPTKKDEALPHTRVSSPSCDKDWSPSPSAPYAQGSRQAFGVMSPLYRISRSEFQDMRGFKRLNGSLFTLSWGTLTKRSSPGGACIVSSKTAPRAVDRNRIKRRCRAILAQILDDSAPGTMYIVVAKKAAIEASFRDMQKEIESLIARLR